MARSILAVMLVAAGPLVDGSGSGDHVRFGLFAAVWIPAAGLADVVGRRRSSPLTDLVALALDLALLAAVDLVLEPSVVVVLAGLLLLVGVHTYLAGRRVGALAGLMGVVLVWVLAYRSAGTGPADVDLFAAVAYSAVLVCVAWLFDAAAAERWRASAGLLRLHEKSDAILTGIGEAVVVTSRQGKILEWNRASTRTFGCGGDEARGNRCSDVLGLLHEVRELDCSEGCALLAMTEGAEPVDVEVWRRLPTGQRQPLLASVSPVIDETGAVAEVVHSFRDITRLKQADEAKTLFLATASHELKTPLTVIRGFSQMLLLPDMVLGEEERLSALRAIDVRAGQLTSIVDRLLMSSRIDAGRIELVPSAVAAGPILAERADALEGATGREVALDIPDDLPEPYCDPDALTTVVDHLLDNAVKYSPNGGPVTITASALDDAVVLEVSDEGVGMTEEQAAHCFDRFWQAEATDVRRFGGTGIGLYIVRSLVEGMDGSISVSSGPGAGSTFRVLLPRADRTAEREDETRSRGRGEQTMIREYMRQLGVPVAPGVAT